MQVIPYVGTSVGKVLYVVKLPRVCYDLAGIILNRLYSVYLLECGYLTIQKSSKVSYESLMMLLRTLVFPGRSSSWLFFLKRWFSFLRDDRTRIRICFINYVAIPILIARIFWIAPMAHSVIEGSGKGSDWGKGRNLERINLESIIKMRKIRNVIRLQPFYSYSSRCIN